MLRNSVKGAAVAPQLELTNQDCKNLVNVKNMAFLKDGEYIQATIKVEK